MGLVRKILIYPKNRFSRKFLIFDGSRESGGDWKELHKDQALYRVAINQNLSSWTDALKNDDELAIFPPITGG